MKPTIGRIVLVRLDHYETELPAIVVNVRQAVGYTGKGAPKFEIDATVFGDPMATTPADRACKFVEDIPQRESPPGHYVAEDGKGWAWPPRSSP